jgi:hypothetical protein
MNQIDQQEYPITGQHKAQKKQETKKTQEKRGKTSNDRIVIMNQQHYFNPYQATFYCRSLMRGLR